MLHNDHADGFLVLSVGRAETKHFFDIRVPLAGLFDLERRNRFTTAVDYLNE